MRCPTCGTENAPDSRFCGGCGARMTPPSSRVAPTHKISDDTAYPPTPAAPPMSAPPASYAPPSIPPKPISVAEPANHRPSSLARAATTPSPTAQRPQLTSDSLLLPPARPVALIAIVLVIDLALAAAGAVLLMKGLADPEPAPQQKSELAGNPQAVAAAPAAAVAPIAPVTPAPAVVEPAEDNAAVATKPADAIAAKPTAKPAEVVAAKTTTSKPAAAKSARKAEAKSTSKDDTVPIHYKRDPEGDTPLAEVNYEREVGTRSVKSKVAFDRCVAAAPNASGAIDVIFEIQADGSVTRVGAGKNTTGNDELARCLVAEITKWRLPPHEGPSVQFVKSFSYP